MASKQNTTKRKGIAISSRYKQAAETFSSQSSKDSSQYSKLSSTYCRARSPRRLGKDFPGKSSSSEKDVSCMEESKISGECTSSTPTSEGHCSLPPINESVIGTNLLGVPKRKARVAVASHKGNVHPKISANQTLNDFTLHIPGDFQKGQGKLSQKDVDEEIDILYTEYLQAKLVESYSLMAYERKCEEALEKMYKAWGFIQELMSKNMKTGKELNLVNYLIMLTERLQKQEQMLLPILDAIPTIETHYEAIAKAVDTAMYNLEVKDVNLSDASGGKEVMQLLQTISGLIENIVKNVQDYEKVVFAAKVQDTFVKQGTFIAQQFKRCSEILSEAGSFVLSETSLKLSTLNLD